MKLWKSARRSGIAFLLGLALVAGTLVLTVGSPRSVVRLPAQTPPAPSTLTPSLTPPHVPARPPAEQPSPISPILFPAPSATIPATKLPASAPTLPAPPPPQVLTATVGMVATPRLAAYAAVDGDHLWLIRDDTLIYSADGGHHWTQQFRGPVSHVAFVDLLHGWLLARGTLWRTVDSGQHWQALYTLPKPPQIPAEVYDQDLGISELAFVSPRQGWLATAYWGLLTTDDGGENWHASPAPPAPYQVQFSVGQHGWGFFGGGAEDPQLRYTADAGRSWTLAAEPPCDWYHNGGLFSFHGPATAWAVCIGRGGGEMNETHLFKTMDGGRHLVAVRSTEPDGGIGGEYPTSLFFLDDQHGWITLHEPGPHGEWQTVLRKTVNGGRAWDTVNIVAEGLGSMRFTSARQGFAIGVSLLGTQDGGATWAPLLGPAPAPQHVVFFDVQRGIGLGRDAVATTMLRTTNGGRTWTGNGDVAPVCAPDIYSGIEDWSALDLAHAWILARCQQQRGPGQRTVLSRTTDGGLTWVLLPFSAGSLPGQTGQVPRTVYFMDATTGYLAGSTAVWITRDGGRSFALLAGASLPNQVRTWFAAHRRPLVGIAFAFLALTPSTPALAVPPTGRAVQVLPLFADGREWQVDPRCDEPSAVLRPQGADRWVQYNLPICPATVLFVDATHAWIRDTHARLYATTDGGATWAQLP